MIDDEVERVGALIAGIDNTELRRLLGLWVSDLEPVICLRASSGSIIGISVCDRFGVAILPVVLEASMAYRAQRTQVIADNLSAGDRVRQRYSRPMDS